MILNWFDASAAVVMGQALAAELDDELQKLKRQTGKHAALNTQKVDKVFSKLTTFKRTQPLNFYKKAKLMNTFKWYLLEHDHDPALVEVLTKKLMFNL